MYHLENRQLERQQHNAQNNDNVIVCSIEGPLSLFKLTDRYGTSLAKLLPSIIFSSGDWSIDAWILRKTMLYGKKLYRFRISKNGETPLPLLADPFYIKLNNNTPTAIVPTSYFDSAVEEIFARKFEEVVAAVLTGWKLVREPDPLIVHGGKAFIHDFVFEKYDRKVYLEIVGFWTPEYLERKLQKLKNIVIGDSSNNNNNSSFANAVDLFIAIDEDLTGSKAISSSSLIPKDKLIYYKNNSR